MRKFEEKLLKGEELSPKEMRDMIANGKIADSKTHKQMGWQKDMSIVFKIEDKYFKLDCLYDLLKVEDTDFYCQPYEVYPVKKMVEITEWKMNNDLLTLAKTYPEYQSLMNIAKAIRVNNLANYFNYEDIETIQNSLFEKVQQENQFGCPVEVLLKALKDDCIVVGKNTIQASISLYLDYETNTEFAIDGTYKLKDYQKTWWLKEDIGE